MDFTQYLQAQNPNSAMAGAMAGPTGGSFGQMAMQMVQNAARQRQQSMAQQAAPQPQAPGGPSLPSMGIGQNPSSPAPTPQPAMAPSAQVGGMDPQFERGYQIGLMLRQMGLG